MFTSNLNLTKLIPSPQSFFAGCGGLHDARIDLLGRRNAGSLA